MSFLDRSVPLKYAMLATVAIAAFTTMFVHGLQNRSDSMVRYGTALPAEVVKADKPKTVGEFLGLWGSTYTNTEVKVTPSSGKPWYYSDVPLSGRVVAGHELKVWFHDGNPDRANFQNWFYTSSRETDATPWPSVGDEVGIAFLWTLLATFIAFIVLIVLPIKFRKRRRPASSRRKPKAV